MPKPEHDQPMLERELIALALNRRRWASVQHSLHPQMFAIETHRAVVSAILDEAQAKGKAPSSAAVQGRLGAARASLVTDILSDARQLPLIRDPEELVEELERRQEAREARSLLSKYVERLQKPGANTAAELVELQAALVRMVDRQAPARIQTMGEVAQQLAIEKAKAIEGGVDPSMPGGLVAFTRTTRGMRRKQCLVVCARPGNGKSALAGHLCDWSAKYRNTMSLIFSLEMENTVWVARIVGRDARIGSELFDKPSTWSDEVTERAVKAMESLTGNGLVNLCDNRGLTVDDICSIAEAHKLRHPELAILVIDHLQLVEAPSSWRENRNREVGRIAKQLRDLSHKLDVALVLLCQLSRAVDSRNDNTPLMSDLRDSGEIEAHADVVLGLHRPNPTRDMVQFTTLKGRDVPPGTKGLARFIGPYFEFQDADIPAERATS